MSETIGSTVGDVQSSSLLINLAPTGMVPTRAMSTAVPLSENEIVNDVLECARLGISIVHLHVRDEAGRPARDKERYARVIGRIREVRDDLIICVSCSGRGGATLEERADVLTLEGDLRPDMASLTLSSLNFTTEESVNSPSVVKGLLERMQDHGIKPELEVFDLGMANVARYLAEKGLLKGELYANVLLGNLAGAQMRLADAASVVAALPHGTIFSFAGLGRTQLPAVALALAVADGVRIGLEDNLWYDASRSLPATNAGLVERTLTMAQAMGRSPMTPAEARRVLSIDPR